MMSGLTKIEKVFLVMVFFTLITSSLGYLYMYKHSAKARIEKTISSLQRAGVDEDIIAKVPNEVKKEDYIYSPVVQLVIIGCTVFLFAIWFSVLICYISDLFEYIPEIFSTFTAVSSIILFCVLVADIVIFLMHLGER